MKRIIYSILFIANLFISDFVYSAEKNWNVKLPEKTLIKAFTGDIVNMETVRESIDMWNSMVGANFLTEDAAESMIIITFGHIGTQYMGVSMPMIAPGFCLIVIDPKAYGRKETIIHEIGHCLGFEDNRTDNKSIMFWQDGPNQIFSKDMVSITRKLLGI